MGQLWYFRIFYVLFFFSASMIFSQTSVFLQSKDLSGTEIGIILASISFAAMISQPIIGVIADRFKNRRLILQILFFASAFFVLFLPQTSGFLPLLVLVFTFSFFLEPTFTLADTTIIEAAKYDDHVEYGKVRWFGSIAWGLGSLTLGLILQFFGGFSTAFLLFAVMMVTAGVMAFRFPNHQAKTTEKIEWHELGHLLKNRHFIFICLFSIFVGGVSLTAG
ncbi:MAG: MFS transporter, partial [Culicoidibacterales bacterium]